MRVEGEITSHLAGLTELFETEMRMKQTEDSYRWMLCRGVAVLMSETSRTVSRAL